MDRNGRLTMGMWLAGIGMILYSGRIFPDVPLLVGSVRLVDSFLHLDRSGSRRAGVVLLLLGTLFWLKLGVVEVLILAGVGLILSAAWRRGSNPKPFADLRLE